MKSSVTLSAKYGEEHVAQIITFGTMAAKAAVRDVGRAMAVPFARSRSRGQADSESARHYA